MTENETPPQVDVSDPAIDAVLDPVLDPELDPDHQHGYLKSKDDYLKRLRRIEGQARGLQRMVEEDKYCIDILTQVSAMTKALHSVSVKLLEEHINHCVIGAARTDEQAGREKVAEAVDAIARLVRS